MSALDMVLQRQVPARPTANNEEGANRDDRTGAGRNDAFSAALSKQQRNAAADRDTAEAIDQTENVDASAVAQDRLEADAAQHDEMLSLLSALRSSAAYSGETSAETSVELGVPAGQESPDQPSVSAPASPDTVEPDAAAAADAGAGPALAPANSVTSVEIGKNIDPAAVVRQAPERPVAPADGTRTLSPATGTVKAMPVSADAKTAPAVLASGGAEAGATRNAPSRTKPQAATGAADPAAVKEAMRTLGLSAEAAAPAAAAAKVSLRGQDGNRLGEGMERKAEDNGASKSAKVEVIENRRFMPALSLSANAQMLAGSLADAGGAALAAQRMAPAQSLGLVGQPQAGQMLHTLKLQLNPVSLGSVTAVLKLTGEDLSVEIKVETAEAYRQLKDDTQSIIKALRGQGYGVEQITVQHVAGADRSSGQMPQSGFQGSQQGQGSGDAQSSGGESGGNSTGRQTSNEQKGQGREHNPNTAAGRTDGVYL
ncbi:flagellar hook-length control protein FliK [Hoeflea sp. YIM 152468]|uniref:flagellar hook-length control protein FliK n=1 Tax=Hoeflea sp. YIM 152468 TaxID=3031759 RepID=UPI0023DB536E|nr:flagellar hook-length control protein FliK [Hoeflea sp. YIM 152468]MDF1610108.1 flagellar hook-length control protein FliK [Hoeflea sp. YIM 152468]